METGLDKRLTGPGFPWLDVPMNKQPVIVHDALNLQVGDELANGEIILGISILAGRHGQADILTDVTSRPFYPDLGIALKPECECGRDECPWC